MRYAKAKAKSWNIARPGAKNAKFGKEFPLRLCTRSYEFGLRYFRMGVFVVNGNVRCIKKEIVS